jgi:hypothetical protein
MSRWLHEHPRVDAVVAALLTCAGIVAFLATKL